MTRRLVVGCAIAAMLGLLGPGLRSSANGPPAPGSPDYIQRDNQNMQDAYGREFGANGQVQNPDYAPALIAEGNENGFDQLAAQLATPNRLALTPGQYFPGWNVGNPLRRGWAGRRGLRVPISYTNRYGALIRGSMFAPPQCAESSTSAGVWGCSATCRTASMPPLLCPMTTGCAKPHAASHPAA